MGAAGTEISEHWTVNNFSGDFHFKIEESLGSAYIEIFCDDGGI